MYSCKITLDAILHPEDPPHYPNDTVQRGILSDNALNTNAPGEEFSQQNRR
jgi:hypothetical protein